MKGFSVSFGRTLSRAAPTPAAPRRTRRLFVRVRAPARFADELARGCFVSTRLFVAPGEEVLLALLTGALGRPLDVPAVVLGRRAAPGGPVGLRVRACTKEHPVLDLLRALEGGSAAGLERQVQAHSRVHVSSSFASREALAVELGRLLCGQVAILPLQEWVRPGDRLDVTAGVRGQPALLCFRALCRAVARVEDQVCCLAALVEEEGRQALEERLARYRDDNIAFTAP